MNAKTITATVLAALCGAFAAHSAWAADTSAPGETVKPSAQLLKDADDVVFSAQELRPIALENLPAPIDLNTAINPPGSEVSGIARTLRHLDPADIPATARAPCCPEQPRPEERATAPPCRRPRRDEAGAAAVADPTRRSVGRRRSSADKPTGTHNHRCGRGAV